MHKVAIAAILVVSRFAGVGFAQSAFVNWETAHVHPLELTPDGTRLLAVNTADNRLEVFDASGGGLVALRSIPVGLDPVSVRARSNSEVWVINHISDSISLVDLPTGRVFRTLLTADEPTDVVFAGSPQRAFVSISQLNQVAVYDPNNLGVSPIVVPIQGEDPRALAVDSMGSTVFVAIFESGNPTTLVPEPQVSSPASPYLGANPPPNNGALFDPPRPPGQPGPPRVGQIVRKNDLGQWMDDNNRDWSALVTWDVRDQDVALIDTSTLAVSYARGLMTTVMNLAVAPSGRVTAVGTEAKNEIRFEPNVRGTFVRSQLASFDPAVPTNVVATDLNPHLDYIASTVPLEMRELSIGDPRALLWHPTEDKGYVAGMGSNNVIVIDSAGHRLTQMAVGQGPTGLAMLDDRLFVMNKFDATISVVDTTTDLVVDVAEFFDPTPAAIQLGRPLLYDTHATSGLGHTACASCHIDGRTDHLAWDLGNPAGALKAVNQTCRQGPGNCIAWHPMKGPMVTQTLQGIIDNEPFHWRGDRENLAAFAVAFTDLQGADAAPSEVELDEFTAFVATIQYPPNPNRNLDGTLRTNLPTSTGTGNAAAGRNIFLNQPVLPGGLTCAGCHALPAGTDLTIDFPGVGPSFQSLKVAQLRNMHEKTGFSRLSLTNNRGFGFNHDGSEDGLFNLIGPPFNFPPGPPGQQQRRDVEAFMLSFAADTHAAVGQQVTFDGSNNADSQLVARYNTFVALANAGTVGLVAKGRVAGADRGYQYLGSNSYQSDRLNESVNGDTLRDSAAPGAELTFTVVPAGSQERIGLDRDQDGHFDRDELDGCSDPNDPQSLPPIYGDLDNSGSIDVDDLLCGLTAFGEMGLCPAADIFPCGGDGLMDVDDLLSLLDAFSGLPSCPGPCAS